MTICIVKVNKLRTPEQRATVCYCGRAFAGWTGSAWCNPYKPRARPEDEIDGLTKFRPRKEDIEDCLSLFRAYAAKQPRQWLESLWEACEHGAKPLGCWCIDATVGDGQEVVCHAQILGEMLFDRFLKPQN